ncbi:ABC transporter ATP-binding protein [Ethanoligenens harbinense]|uniref:ABC transporter related protein n=1 Tax=Ethanoligenens harbinense (strain DSM 18485 / JCM 12961 / CGMCC 1.5033 / YUAN-3) TaxID=663278 RepID=E6U8L1_ETHHY|nr:ABC transporter ATP-binding protein [Ethanoligenens harbinense]ADU26002.1 ABC transporter related protein [Ethanoligenens harbinense YUAN-3]AVQ95149.1 ABC transporter ATP-binding protein [Ethanoligenens harbinense YUAN-3]AYF40562.1 ABC transporter ATP-binding protein [Ethanoligenens harbinense]QCN91395.1 ABC transporter ATP-binding protein [Ethanoligenens harbinense]
MLKIYKNLKGYIPHICVILVLIFAQVLTDLYLPTLMSDIVNTGIMKEDVNYILHMGGLMIGVAGIGIVCAVVAVMIGSRVAIGLGGILRSKIFRHVEKFSLHEFDKFGSSTLITRTTNDIIQIQTVTILIINMMLRAPLTAIGGIILAYREDKSLTIIFAIALPVLIAVIAIIMSRAMPLFKQVQKKLDKINLVLRENLTGIRVIRAFNRIGHENARFDEANQDLTRTYITVNRIMAFLMPVLMLALNVMQLSIIWFGSVRVDAGSMNIGALAAFIQYAALILINFIMLAMMFIFIPRAQAASERISEVLETAPEILDPAEPKHADGEQGYVEFRNVCFSYQGAERPALSGVSFSAKPGETTAIIGGTGSGKSTLVNLIPRFYDVDEGQVLVDGVDVREQSQKELRAKIGFVPQKAILFTGTITANLRYGKKDATDEEITHASEIAQASGFVGEMREGYDTVLAEGGLNLSGGQKQRLSIARALVRRPEIYVFDDSFSALDFKTDARLRAALKKETGDATVLIVAQRVGTVMGADRIIVLDDGKVAGIGTHEEMMKTCEVYREIVSSQLSEEELA